MSIITKVLVIVLIATAGFSTYTKITLEKTKQKLTEVVRENTQLVSDLETLKFNSQLTDEAYASLVAFKKETKIKYKTIIKYVYASKEQDDGVIAPVLAKALEGIDE